MKVKGEIFSSLERAHDLLVPHSVGQDIPNRRVA